MGRLRLQGLRLGSLAAACLYLCLVSSAGRWLAAVCAASPAPVASQAIEVPGSMEPGHACCCPHRGGACEKGCCRDEAASESGEACLRACGAPSGNAVPSFHPGFHAAPSPAGYVLAEVTLSVLPFPAPSPLGAALRPRDKVPIA